jgi:hypothetical protein
MIGVLNYLGVYKGSRAKGLGVNRLLAIQGLGVLRSWYSIWSNHLR